MRQHLSSEPAAGEERHPEVAELSLNAEWKLVQAIKQVFAPDEVHETEDIAAFMADWAKADAAIAMN
jgi:exodeoxyribonuclease VIII